MFSACIGLQSITIPNGVTSIGAWAFGFCKGLQSITVPEGVKSIEYAAFAHCANLRSITISDGVIRIAGDAFVGCKNLTVYCSENSYARKYAETHGIPFKIVSIQNNET